MNSDKQTWFLAATQDLRKICTQSPKYTDCEAWYRLVSALARFASSQGQAPDDPHATKLLDEASALASTGAHFASAVAWMVVESLRDPNPTHEHLRILQQRLPTGTTLFSAAQETVRRAWLASEHEPRSIQQCRVTCWNWAVLIASWEHLRTVLKNGRMTHFAELQLLEQHEDAFATFVNIVANTYRNGRQLHGQAARDYRVRFAIEKFSRPTEKTTMSKTTLVVDAVAEQNARWLHVRRWGVKELVQRAWRRRKWSKLAASSSGGDTDGARLGIMLLGRSKAGKTHLGWSAKEAGFIQEGLADGAENGIRKPEDKGGTKSLHKFRFRIGKQNRGEVSIPAMFVDPPGGATFGYNLMVEENRKLVEALHGLPWLRALVIVVPPETACADDPDLDLTAKACSVLNELRFSAGALRSNAPIFVAVVLSKSDSYGMLDHEYGRCLEPEDLRELSRSGTTDVRENTRADVDAARNVPRQLMDSKAVRHLLVQLASLLNLNNENGPYDCLNSYLVATDADQIQNVLFDTPSDLLGRFVFYSDPHKRGVPAGLEELFVDLHRFCAPMVVTDEWPPTL